MLCSPMHLFQMHVINAVQALWKDVSVKKDSEASLHEYLCFRNGVTVSKASFLPLERMDNISWIRIHVGATKSFYMCATTYFVLIGTPLCFLI